MKKIFTFLFCATVFSSAFAQRDNNWSNRNTTVVYGNSGYGHDNGFDKKYYQNNKYAVQQRDLEIQKVNYKYDIQVKQVLDNRFFSRRQKRNIITTLKNQKNQEISSINLAYTEACNDNNQRYNDHDRNGHGR